MKLAVCFGCIALILSARMVSANDSVTLAPGIRLVAYNQFPELKVPAGMEPYRHAYFVLVNDSDRAITAVSAIWSYTSAETGQRKAGIMKTLDSYMLDKTQFRPVVAAHSRAPLEPGSAAAYFFQDARDKQITLTVDAIIFEDGEITGADTLQTADEITARYAAAHDLSTRFHLGRLAGKGPEQMLKEMDGDTSNRWRNHYAGKIAASVRQNPKATSLHLRDLDSMPEPPKFFRKTQ